ncbi:ABC transporter permease [Lentzea tibetensis]|uniref:ABC transporter permease n=1 Tax=Lentzea tibetensis TaxID=2591470 RepID=A0A563EV30_9PSEU|nr:ABC transporter permease [Lentzea tibetensis]TWP51526.1 ABC transporter permease [Lentzea tibetensis]
MTSAYPIEIDTLTERVKARAIELGQVPSRNRIKTEFKVGAPKASAVLAALEAAGFDPTHRDADEVESPRRLHSVPATEVEDAETVAVVDAGPVAVVEVEPMTAATEVTEVVDPVPAVVDAAEVADDVPASAPVKRVRSWPLLLLAAGAFVAIWGGWVGLGELTGFGPIRLLPGIADGFVINSAITLPIGVEAYAAYALRVWLSGGTRSVKARRFARWSAIGSLVLGAAGQVAYHLMVAAGVTSAPWWITTFVSCLPVVVLGCGAALTHLLHDETEAQR